MISSRKPNLTGSVPSRLTCLSNKSSFDSVSGLLHKVKNIMSFGLLFLRAFSYILIRPITPSLLSGITRHLLLASVQEVRSRGEERAAALLISLLGRVPIMSRFIWYMYPSWSVVTCDKRTKSARPFYLWNKIQEFLYFPRTATHQALINLRRTRWNCKRPCRFL